MDRFPQGMQPFRDPAFRENLNEMAREIDMLKREVAFARQAQQQLTKHKDRFKAEITGYALLSTNKWKYAWTEVEYDIATNTWAAVTNGRSGTTTTDYAINGIEGSNNGTGIEGNSSDLTGITLTDSALDTTNVTFTLNPVQGDPVVDMESYRYDGTNTVYIFHYENWTAIDGGIGT